MFYFLKKIILFHNDINNEKYVGRSLVLDLVRLGEFCGEKINNCHRLKVPQSNLWLNDDSSFWCLELTKNINNIANLTHNSYRK